MIVLPVEKQFDWKNPPWVLGLLVFLNVFAHLFYQSNDAFVVNVVLDAYVDQGFYGAEAEHYETFVLEQEGPAGAARVRELRADHGDYAVAWEMLQDEPFESWLAWNRDYPMSAELGESWRERRRSMADALGRVSTVRFGLEPADLGPITLLTHQFLHGDVMHLLGNMFFLVLCGFAVEAAIGHLRFLAFYLVGGALAGLGHALVDLDSTVPLVGASGAISGVMAMYLTLFRLKRIEFFYWIFVFVGYVRLPALAVLPVYLGKELWMMLADPDSNIAFMAHAAGFVAGAVLIALVLLLRPKAVDEEYIEEDQSVDPARVARAGIYEEIGRYRFDLARRRLDALREVEGDSFELRRLAQQLFEADHADGHEDATDALVSWRDASPVEIREQARLLGREPKILERLPDDELMRLGARLGRIEDLSNGVRVLDTLVDRGIDDSRIGVIARRLATAFKAQNDGPRARQYAELAERYA
jgi:membrane associated rhomboid family serine protease